MNENNSIKTAINELFSVQRPYENCIKNSERIWKLLDFIIPLMSYANGIKVLIENKQYDSTYPIARAFFEIYGSLIYLINNYFEVEEFDNYFKKVIVDNMYQDIRTYSDFKNDKTIPNSKQKELELNSYIDTWEKRIIEFFPCEKPNINNRKKYKSLKSIIYKLKKYYDEQYENKDVFIGDAIKNNEEIITATGKAYNGSYLVYRLLCHETHANIDALDRRATNNGYFVSNKSSQSDAIAISDLVYWSIKDVSSRLKRLLEKEFKSTI